MKKWIFAVIFVLITSFIMGVYFTNKLPNNYLHNFDGTYQYSSVLEMYAYEDKIITILTNYEKTQDSWDDDDCYDDMINIAIFDDTLNDIRLIPLAETLTLENDGNGIRSGEVTVRSSQSNHYIYIQASVYDITYMFVFDVLLETYEVKVLEMDLDSFYVEEDSIYAVSVELNPETELHQVNYYELDLGMNVVKSSIIGSIFLEIDAWGKANKTILRPKITSDFIVIQGDLINQEFDDGFFSVYDFSLNEILTIGNEDLFASTYYIIEEKLYYDSVTYLGEETTFVYDNHQFDLYPITSNGFQYGINPTTTFEFNYLDSDFLDNKVRLIVRETGEEIIINYNHRVIYRSMYEFNGTIYVVAFASFAESQLSRFINGTGRDTEYIIEYSVNELLSTK
jgi:hypothetical protein